jgi:hypothetical protein
LCRAAIWRLNADGRVRTRQEASMANGRAVLGLVARSMVAAVIGVLIELATNLASDKGITLPFHLQGMRKDPVAWLKGLVAFAVVWTVLEGFWRCVARVRQAAPNCRRSSTRHRQDVPSAIIRLYWTSTRLRRCSW